MQPAPRLYLIEVPPAHARIRVTLYDVGGSQLEVLEAKKPRSWSSSGHKKSNTASGRSYSEEYRIRVTIRVDGASIVLESSALSREPAVATVRVTLELAGLSRETDDHQVSHLQ